MESFCLSVQAALSPTNSPSERGDALAFLEKYQNSIEAWNTSIEILSSPSTFTADISFFASQTLKHKVQSSFSQLTEPQVTSLQQLLFSLLLDSSKETPSPLICKQLVLAFGALLLQCPIEMGPQNIIPLLLENLKTGDSLLSLNSLSLLSVLPEQLDNSLIPLPSSIKERFISTVLDPSVDEIVSLLISSLRGKEEITCLLAWMRYGKIDFKILVNSDLLPLLFQRLLERSGDDGDSDDIDTDEIVSLLGEAICESFYKIFRSLDTEPPFLDDDDDYGADDLAGIDGVSKRAERNVISDDSLSRIQVILNQLSPSLSTTTTTTNSGEQFLRTSVQVFVEAGESLLTAVVERKNIGLLRDFLTIFIRIALITRERSTLSYDLLSCSFMFWEQLEDVMVHDLGKGNRSGDGEYNGNDEMFSLINDAIAEVYKELCFNHLSYPLEDFASHDERDSFRDFRHVIGDCLCSLNRVLGSSSSLGLLLSWPGCEMNWQQMEALLFAIRVIDVDRREEEVMPSLLNKIFTTIATFRENILLKGFMLLLSNLSEWIAHHPSFIQPAFEAISFTLLDYDVSSDSDLLLAASHSLKMLSLDCGTAGSSAGIHTESLWASEERRSIFRNIYEKRCNPMLCTSKSYLDCCMNCSESISTLITEETDFSIFIQSWISTLTNQDSIAIPSLKVITVWVDCSSKKPFISSFIANILSFFLQNHQERSVEWIKESLYLSSTFLTSLPMQRSLEASPLVIQYLFSLQKSSPTTATTTTPLPTEVKEAIFDLLNRGLQSDHNATIFTTPLTPLILPLLQQDCPWNTLLLFTSIISHPVQQALVQDPLIMNPIFTLIQNTIEDACSSIDDHKDTLTFLTLYNGRSQQSTFEIIPLGINAIHQKIVQGFPIGCLRQIANYLRSLFLSDRSRTIEIFDILLNSLPRTLFTDGECFLWLEEYKEIQSSGSYNARRMREFINSFIKSCRRRF